MSARQAFRLVFRPELSTAERLTMTFATAVSFHLLAGTFLDQGLTMEQTQDVLRKAIELIPELESGVIE